MTTTATQKKCWNCKEAVHEYASCCPYCGVELPAENSANETGDALQPPYRLVNTMSGDGTAPASPFGSTTGFFSPEATQEESEETPIAEKPTPEPTTQDTSKDHVKQVAIPLAALLSGSVFFMFGLVLLLYSKEGVFTLHWNGNMWPYFLFSSLVLLFFGWRTLQNVHDPEDNS